MSSSEIEIHELLKELESSLMADIQNFATLNLNQKAQIQALNSSIQSKLSQHRANTRELELCVEELDTQDERQEVVTLITTHATSYNSIQRALRAAAHQQRTNAAQAASQKRSELLSGADAGVRRRQLQNDSDMVNASEGITASLRRTRQVLGEELEHTGTTLAAMDASHNQLGKTADEYVGQHRLLGKSKGLLRTLNWQNKSETYLLWFGLSLFIIIAAYVVQKRAMYFVPASLRPGRLVGNLASMVTFQPPPVSVDATTQQQHPGDAQQQHTDDKYADYNVNGYINDKYNNNNGDYQATASTTTNENKEPGSVGSGKGKGRRRQRQLKNAAQTTATQTTTNNNDGNEVEENIAPAVEEEQSIDTQPTPVGEAQAEEHIGVVRVDGDEIAVDLEKDFVRQMDDNTNQQQQQHSDNTATNNMKVVGDVVVSSCVDEVPQCEDWAAHGECERNVKFMIGDDAGFVGKCRKSCHACGGGAAMEAHAAS